MTYRPVNKQVIFKKLEDESTTTESGLIITSDTRSQLIFKGKVIAFDEHYPMDIEVGETILYSPTQAITVDKDTDEEIMSISYLHILAVVSE